MVHTLLAAYVAVSFPGGNVSDLAKSIADSTRQSVVFQAGAAEGAKGFEYDPFDLNQLAKAVLDATGFKRAPGAEHVFHHGRLGSWMYSTRGLARVFNDDPWRQGGAWPQGALKDGKVTLQSKSGESVLLETFPKDILPKPIDMHWTFERLALKAWVRDVSALDFMNLVAKAVGGRLLQRQDRYVLDIDPAETQRRAVATLVEAKKSPQFTQMGAADRGKIELSRAVLASLGPAQLATLLLTPQGMLRFEIGPSTRPAVHAYVQSLLQASASEQEPREQVLMVQRGRDRDEQRGNQRNMGLILRRADPRIIGTTTIDARFDVRVQLLTLDNYGRPGRLVNLP